MVCASVVLLDSKFTTSNSFTLLKSPTQFSPAKCSPTLKRTHDFGLKKEMGSSQNSCAKMGVKKPMNKIVKESRNTFFDMLK
jgi:hypothetical protein